MTRGNRRTHLRCPDCRCGSHTECGKRMEDRDAWRMRDEPIAATCKTCRLEHDKRLAQKPEWVPRCVS